MHAAAAVFLSVYLSKTLTILRCWNVIHAVDTNHNPLDLDLAYM